MKKIVLLCLLFSCNSKQIKEVVSYYENGNPQMIEYTNVTWGDTTLIKKAQKVSDSGRKEVIKTWSRRSTILPQFVGLTFGVYNGQKFVPVSVNENMVGHKLGEFSPTRSFKGHTAADKKVTK